MSILWRAGYAHWPPLARLLFLPLAIGGTALALLVYSRLWPLWDGLTASAPVRALTGFGRGIGTCAHALEVGATSLAGLLPNGAATAIVIVVLAAYAMFFGIGASAFRILYAPNRTT